MKLRKLQIFGLESPVCSGLFLLLVAALSVLSGCRSPLKGEREGITILSWNAQNIFDASDDGSEYSEFRPSGGWKIDDYRGRLTSVAEVLSTAVKGGADIVLLQEIENQGVLEDLNNDYLFSLGYRHLAASAQEGSAVQLGILSRFPLLQVCSRSLSLPGAPPMRPILEAEVELPGGYSLIILVCHWKSRAGGVEETELWRRAGADLVARRLQELAWRRPDLPVLVAGDLNESWNEFDLTGGGYPTALFPWGEEYPAGGSEPDLLPLLVSGNAAACLGDPDGNIPGTLRGPLQGLLPLFSPWAADPSLRGSYTYQDSWEKIDHLLFSGAFFDRRGVEFSSFQVHRGYPWSDEEGYPKRWNSSTGYGYSDHLPVGCTINLEKE